MIDSSPELKTVLEQDTTLSINSGCTIEYNLNSLVDNITLSGAEISRIDSAGNFYQPFKKLFPIDSIVKPVRPTKAGIKYAIVGDVSASSYRNPKSVTYPLNYRTYYPGAETAYKYYVSDKNVGLDVTATYPKAILSNKIVVRFELSHSTPATWTIYANGSSIVTGTSANIKAFGNVDAGTLIVYWNGTSWSTTEPATYAAPVSITSLRLMTGAVTNQYVGLIELSPRWIIDISDRVVDMSISKEASSSSEDILPVGYVSANSLSMSLVSYEDARQVVSFDKSMTFDSTKTYMYKMAQISPYFKIYHAAGNLSDSKGAYEKIKQGVFYLDTWSIAEFGEVSLTALDGAKILQETIAPGIVCKDYSTPAIIRTLLDNVGFTNYNFNITGTESSLFSPRFWWTDDQRTVWESIQQLCRDSQMVASFDENNVLQFYTRENVFNYSSSADWNFRYAASGNNLPNILSLDKQDLSSANQVKVLWNSVTTNEYVGNAQPLWKSGNSFMGALSLEQPLPATSGAGSYVSLKMVVTDERQQNVALNTFSGYLVIDSEIIEYDAIQYDYVDLNGSRQSVDVTSQSDSLKWLGLSMPGANNYQPNGKYRIKTRGAFNTQVADHFATAQQIINSWSGYDVDYNVSTSDPSLNNSSFTSTTSSTQTPPMSAWDLWMRAERGYDPYNMYNSLDETGTQASPVTTTGTAYAVQDNREISTSLFRITNNSTKANRYSMAIKNSGINTAYDRHAFGSSIFFQSSSAEIRGQGGIGFFTSSNGLDGYYVLIQTTTNLSDKSDKEIKILKAKNGKITVLNDTQKGSSSKTLTGILGGISYKVDINTFMSSGVRVIDVYINNFKITATDTSDLVAKTSNVAMFAASGKANFDYFYATPITESQYNSGVIQNVYIGKYGNNTLNFLYGDKIIENKNVSSGQVSFLEEFGTVARELRKIKIKYEARPANPLYASIGINKNVSILGERLSSFGAEVYAINNSGTYTPLDDSDLYSFSIIGNYIVVSGQHEYVSNTLSENTVAEPVIFESSWIQSESDAKALTTWIQGQWSKQQQVVNLETFGNPLIAIGDVISINYPSNDFDGTEKFVVTQVNNSFKEGLQTSITARSIYS